MGIFSKLFVAVMAHIIMENADKKIKLLLICFQLKIVDILLSFFLLASLYYYCLCCCVVPTDFSVKQQHYYTILYTPLQQ